ncbi:MAG: HAD-IB family hydrolase [archaeon]
MKKTIAAFFDVDYTIVCGSTSLEFILYNFRKGKISPMALAKSGYYILKYKIGKLDYHKLSENAKLPLINGMDIDTVKILSDKVFQKKIIKKISKKALSRIDFHKKSGHKIVLATGSFDFIVKPLSDYLFADMIATKAKVTDGKYTSKIEGYVCYADEKAKQIKIYSEKNNIDLKNSYAYSDSLSDEYTFTLVGNPYLVNPDKKRKKEAIKKNYDTIEF